jgi:hypothetical protein
MNGQLVLLGAPSRVAENLRAKNYDMKLKAIIAIAFGFVLATDALKADAPSVPQGDQHVALLAQQLNDFESATNLFQRCVNQDRPIVEAANALNVLADNLDRMGAHFSQFYAWAKAETPPVNSSSISRQRVESSFTIYSFGQAQCSKTK